MNRQGGTAVASVLAIVVIGLLIAWVGERGGAPPGETPVFAICVGAAFLIQWLAFVPAFMLRTEKFFDLIGSLTFVTVTLMAIILGPPADSRALLLAALIVIWASRLGTFLVVRIRKAGSDERFDKIKTSFSRFLMTWTLQGLWVTLTVAPALVAMTSSRREALGGFALPGFLVWIAGFAIEVIADEQKRRFRADPVNAGKFIDKGLWSLSRHPNYFGEIALWFGVAVIAFPVLEGWQYATLISPVFVYVLLTRISGIPLLEKRAEARWGGEPDFEDYKRKTRKLIPLP